MEADTAHRHGVKQGSSPTRPHLGPRRKKGGVGEQGGVCQNVGLPGRAPGATPAITMVLRLNRGRCAA